MTTFCYANYSRLTTVETDFPANRAAKDTTLQGEIADVDTDLNARINSLDSSLTLDIDALDAAITQRTYFDYILYKA